MSSPMQAWDLGAYDEAREAWEAATEMRDAAQVHNYGLYCLVGALLSLIGGAGLMAWRWRKK